MEKRARDYENHYIVCGVGNVGLHIANELHATKRQFVMVDTDKTQGQKVLETFPGGVFIEGDATDNSTLLKAGIQKAIGLFAATGDDNQNLIVSLTAKQLNPKARVIARCNDLQTSEKMKRAGADTVVAPTFIGGMRMASEMIRPTVVSFLDVMLRDKEKNLRIEEVGVPESFAGKPVSALTVRKRHNLLLLAIKGKEGWAYNPDDDHVLEPNDSLIFLVTPEERIAIEAIFQKA